MSVFHFLFGVLVLIISLTLIYACNFLELTAFFQSERNSTSEPDPKVEYVPSFRYKVFNHRRGPRLGETVSFIIPNHAYLEWQARATSAVSIVF